MRVFLALCLLLMCVLSISVSALNDDMAFESIRECLSAVETEIDIQTESSDEDETTSSNSEKLRAVLPDQAVWGPDTTASGSCGNGMTWTLSESGVLAIHGSGKMNDFTKESLPSWNLFKNGIRHVVFNDDITRIGNYAFYSCSSIESVELPKNLKVIGESAFLGCVSLKAIDFPESVTEIEQLAFGVNYTMKKVALPPKLTEISGGCFGMCTALEEITIPAGVTYIDEVAFYQCTELTKVYYGGMSKSQVTIHPTDNSPIRNAEWICRSAEETYIRCECSNIYVTPPANCENAIVIIAAYESDGHMLDACLQRWNSGEELSFEFQDLEDAEEVRLFLLDKNYRPFKKSISIADATGHDWLQATCSEPKTCSVCYLTSGEALGHSYKNGFCTRCGEAQPVAVTRITLNKSRLTLGVNATSTLTATVYPSNATDKTVTWSSSNNAVVTVDANGKLTGICAGTAVITATAGDFTAKCTVTVETVVVESSSSNAAFRYLARECQKNGSFTGVNGEYVWSYTVDVDTFSVTYSTVTDTIVLGIITDDDSYCEHMMTIPATMEAPFLTETTFQAGSTTATGTMYISPYTLSDDHNPLTFLKYTGPSDTRSSMFDLSCTGSQLSVLTLNQYFLAGSGYDVGDLGFDAILGEDYSEERVKAQALAQTILNKGTLVSSNNGNRYVSKKYSLSKGATLTVTINAYKTDPNRIHFSSEYVQGGTRVRTSIWYQIDGHGAAPTVSVETLSSSPFMTIYTSAPFDCRTYEYGDELDFYATSLYPSGVAESDWEPLSNAGFKLAMSGFEATLSSLFGLSLQELGFSSYVE